MQFVIVLTAGYHNLERELMGTGYLRHKQIGVIHFRDEMERSAWAERGAVIRLDLVCYPTESRQRQPRVHPTPDTLFNNNKTHMFPGRRKPSMIRP